MIQAVDILTELERLGVTVEVEGEMLCLRPKAALDEELLARIRDAKPEIMAALVQLTEAVQPTRCAHCEGTGECGCPACNLRRVSGPVPCSMCEPRNRQLWLAATRPKECWHCEQRRLNGESGPCQVCKGKESFQ